MDIFPVFTDKMSGCSDIFPPLTGNYRRQPEFPIFLIIF